MTEMEKALYADVCWLKLKLERLRLTEDLAERQDVIEAAVELRGTITRYMGD
jgi:hypothetical protein